MPEPHEDRWRAGSFGEDAPRYDRARPSYPAALVDDLVGPDVRRVLDIGCGTGIAARLFAARGCSVLGVEPDARMAAVARGHGIDVAVAAFETWELPGERFDLVIAAQSWHWVDPAAGSARAAGALRAGGRFAAFWNSYASTPEVHAAFAEVYQRHPPDPPMRAVATGTAKPGEVHIPALEASGLFEPFEEREYPWTRVYTRQEWVDQLPTHSNHRTLPPAILEAVLAEIGAVIDGFGGRITVDHTTRLITAARRRR